MHGTGVAIVTPFTAAGAVDDSALTGLVGELEERGVDFVVPVGTTGESVMLNPDEQAHVIEVVADAASVPVVAGTGQPSLRRTVEATKRAVAAGADAALVVTPFYYTHDQSALVEYYHSLADVVDLPVYAYSIPSRTGMAIEPDTTAELADHPNLVGMKDSSGDLDRLQRAVDRTASDSFEILVGHGGLYAHALEMGAVGGILALANIAPEGASSVYASHVAGDRSMARERNRELVELNRAITSRFSVAGLKAAMRLRGLPAGHVRSPHQPVADDVEAELESILDTAGLLA